MLTMRLFWLLVLLLVAPELTFGQKKISMISFYSSYLSGNDFAYPKILGREAKTLETGFFQMGIEYSSPLKKNLFVNAGLQFSNHVQTVSYWMGNPFVPQFEDNKGELSLLTLPISLQFNFWKYGFVRGGLVVDFQIKNNIYNKFTNQNNVICNQSGIGSVFGFGIKVPLNKKFSVYTAVNNEIHGILLFSNPDFKKQLVDLNLRAGLQLNL